MAIESLERVMTMTTPQGNTYRNNNDHDDRVNDP